MRSLILVDILANYDLIVIYLYDDVIAIQSHQTDVCDDIVEDLCIVDEKAVKEFMYNG